MPWPSDDLIEAEPDGCASATTSHDPEMEAMAIQSTPVANPASLSGVVRQPPTRGAAISLARRAGCHAMEARLELGTRDCGRGVGSIGPEALHRYLPCS